MITGTIRNAVKMGVMQNQWQQKKSEGIFAGQDRNKEIKNKEMTAAEREMAMFQQQVFDIQQNREKDNIQSELEAKIQSGHELTSEEVEYLRKNNPQAYKEYEELRQEKRSYREALEHCKSKEEAEQLKFSKMGSFMSQVKEIANNPHIPKMKKKEMMEKLMKLTDVVAKEHARFVSTPHYQGLPDKEWDEADMDSISTDILSDDKDVEDSEKSKRSDETDSKTDSKTDSMRGEFAGILVDIKL